MAPNVIQNLIETAREAILLVNSSMSITAANRPAVNAFSRNGEGLASRRLSEIIRDAKLHDSFNHVLKTDSRIEAKLLLKGVLAKNYDVFISPVEINGQRYAIGIFYDTTKIENLERIRQEFLTNVSHELRTPLTSIMAFVETLEDGAIDDPESSRRFLSVIRRNAERMHTLISDILELSMIESGNISIFTGQIKLHALVNEIFLGLSVKSEENEIALINTVPHDVTVNADSFRLEQMLTNLIDNAVKFNRITGTVTVAHNRFENNDIISVEDTGEGIIEQQLQRIFERFYRIDRSRTREIGGTGLGLAIVKHLAKLHKGDVNVRSVLGKGTTFSLHLPILNPDETLS